MKKILLACSILLTACKTFPRTPEVQYCMNTTPRESGARWDCLKNAHREQEQKQREAAVIIQKQREAAVINRWQNICSGFGFIQGTDAFAQCMLNQHQQQQITNAQNAAELEFKREALEQKINAQRLQPALRNSTNCTSYRSGDSIRTSCD